MSTTNRLGSPQRLVAEIKAALAEAKAGDFATRKEVLALARKWKHRSGRRNAGNGAAPRG